MTTVKFGVHDIEPKSFLDFYVDDKKQVVNGENIQAYWAVVEFEKDGEKCVAGEIYSSMTKALKRLKEFNIEKDSALSLQY